MQEDNRTERQDARFRHPTRWLPNVSQLVTRSEADMLLFSTALKLLLFPS